MQTAPARRPSPPPLPRPLMPGLLLQGLLMLAIAAPAHAQRTLVQRGIPVDRSPAALPSPRLPPATSGPDAVLRGRGELPAMLESRLRSAPGLERAQRIERHLRLHRDVLDVDGRGAPVLRSEVVAIDPAPEALERVRDAGFSIIGDRTLDELGLRVVVLRSPVGTGTRAALRRLRRMDPEGSYDFNHVYFGSASAAASRAGMAASSGRSGPGAVRVGLIDSGVSTGHPVFAGVDVHTWGCDGSRHPHAHGTAVASLLIGGADGAAARGSELYAADIYCGRPAGGAVTGFAEAMAWMARENVGVINLSLVGPHNALLERATKALAARGHVLVAAVGNDGPAAAPLYPAAYPEVIGVTAVDPRDRALPEAGRGRQVDFAAPGSGLRVARPAGDWGTARGTSFAAPLVARAAAALISNPDAAEATRARAQLAERALDLGSRGRDNTYGHGLVDAHAQAPALGAR